MENKDLFQCVWKDTVNVFIEQYGFARIPDNLLRCYECDGCMETAFDIRCGEYRSYNGIKDSVDKIKRKMGGIDGK